MTWWEVLLIYVLPGVALFAVITLLVVGPRMARRPRYRVGQPWPFPSMWWTANPAGARFAPVEPHAAAGREAGGARGNW